MDDSHHRVINSAKIGDLEYIKSQPKAVLYEARCDVGCTILHWAAGLGFTAMVEFLLGGVPIKEAMLRSGDIDKTSGPNDDDDGDGRSPIFDNVNIQAESKLAKGRTPLHYAARNGHLEMVKILIEKYQADPFAKARQGVTSFQLAIWQNHFNVCQYFVDQCGVVTSSDINEFGCGAIHWLGIIPYHRANSNVVDNSNKADCDDDNNNEIVDDQNAEGTSLMPLAKWIFSQPNIDIHARQNQGHTVLHKAAWGGHLALIRYLHETFNMYDNCLDCAGNYAADICDMMNTKRHKKIALYLRSQCSLERLQSLKILALTENLSLTHDEIRKAYLNKAKLFHPDSKARVDKANEQYNENIEFDQIREAYEHLTSNGGISCKQKNPAHSIHLLLEMQSKKMDTEDCPGNNNSSIDDDNLFKARLLAVLLDFGEKGMNLGNIPKRWDKIWPSSPLESYFNGQKRKSGDLLKFIKRRAGDVVKIVQTKQAADDKQSGRKGAIIVMPRDLSRADVISYAALCTTKQSIQDK